METVNAIRTRRSIRAFTPEPVPLDDVQELLEVARWAPSWANAQGWDVFVVSDGKLEEIKEVLAAEADAGREPETDVRMPRRGEWPEHIQERMTYRRPAPGEAPAPPQRPGLWNFYGAPVMLFFGVHERLAIEYACFDLGLLVENVCLAAVDRGLGTCIMAMSVRYADKLHELLPAEEVRFVVGVALGHPHWNSELNAVERPRCGFDEIVRWIE